MKLRNYLSLGVILGSLGCNRNLEDLRFGSPRKIGSHFTEEGKYQGEKVIHSLYRGGREVIVLDGTSHLEIMNGQFSSVYDFVVVKRGSGVYGINEVTKEITSETTGQVVLVKVKEVTKITGEPLSQKEKDDLVAKVYALNEKAMEPTKKAPIRRRPKR